LAGKILDLYFPALPGGVTILPRSGGIFEVYLDDEKIFSKTALDRFPEDGEVEGILDERIG
jgi:selT/selW/selH-like putative selenoprotein